jgi:hypothetical protein
MKSLQNAGSTYEAKGCSQLLPIELRGLQRKLTCTQSIVDLQTWTIIILATALFLRHDEFHKIKVDNFVLSLFMVLKNKIQALAVKVKGKKDNREVTLLIYANDDYPELCPVRALLVYCYMIGIKSGLVFPSSLELFGDAKHEKNKDGVYLTTIPYDTFDERLKALCSDALSHASHRLEDWNSYVPQNRLFTCSFWKGKSC